VRPTTATVSEDSPPFSLAHRCKHSRTESTPNASSKHSSAFLFPFAIGSTTRGKKEEAARNNNVGCCDLSHVAHEATASRGQVSNHIL
jgi:hypothetical protein